MPEHSTKTTIAKQHCLNAENCSTSCQTPESEDDEIMINSFASWGDDIVHDSDQELLQKADSNSAKLSSNDKETILADAGVVTFVTVPMTSKTQLVRPVASPHPLSPARIVQDFYSSTDPISFFETPSETRIGDHNDDDGFVDYEIGSSVLIERIMEEDEHFDKADFVFTNIVEVFNDVDSERVVHDVDVVTADLVDTDSEYNGCQKRSRSSSYVSVMSIEPCPSQKKLRATASCVPSSSESGSIDGVDLDRQLEDELYCSSSINSMPLSGKKTPIPLLTPPSSPLTVVLESGSVATVCEWPSNLIVDSALQAVNELRPLSPASLEMLEINEQDRVGSVF